MKDMAERLLEMMIQTNINDIAGLYSKIPDEFNFTFLVAMKVMLEGLLPTLSDRERELYEGVLEASETTVIRLQRPVEDENQR